MQWIQKINLQVELVANIESIKRDAFNKRDMSNEGRTALVHVPSIAYSKCMIDRKLQTVDIAVDFNTLAKTIHSTDSLTFVGDEIAMILNV